MFKKVSLFLFAILLFPQFSSAQNPANQAPIFEATVSGTTITASVKGISIVNQPDTLLAIQKTPLPTTTRVTSPLTPLNQPKKEVLVDGTIRWTSSELVGNTTYFIRAENDKYLSPVFILKTGAETVRADALIYEKPENLCKSIKINGKLNNLNNQDFTIELQYSRDKIELAGEALPTGAKIAKAQKKSKNFGIDEDGSYLFEILDLSPSAQYFTKQIIKSSGGAFSASVADFNSCVGYIAAGTTAASDRYNQRSYRLLSDLSGKSVIPDYDLCIEEVAAKKRPEGSCNNQIGDYLNIMIKVLIGASAAWLVLQIVLKGYQYITTDIPFLKTNAKERIFESFGGLLLALSAYLILNTINPQLVTGTLNVGNIDIGVEEVYDRADDLSFMSRLESLSTSGITANINDDTFIAYLAHQQGAGGANAILQSVKNGTPVSSKINGNMSSNFNRRDAQKTINTSELTPINFLNYWSIRVAAFKKNPSSGIPTNINTQLLQVSQETGISLATLQVMCRIESGCDGKNAIEVVNKYGYAGLFQLSNSIYMKSKKTGIWEEFKKPNGEILDGYHNAYAGAQYIKSNLTRIKK
jgi:hypothetical protein